jgi:adenylate kinase
MYIVLLGAPGAGKGTQAAIISQKTGLTHIASGDLFRQAVQNGTELGKLVKSYMDKGMLAPDDMTIRVIMERLGEPDCAKGCIFDGFPRTLDQAKALDKTLKEQKKGIDKAVFIDVPDEELVKRLGGRWTCKNCQSVYHEVASPPKIAGRCDKCGGELYQRPDDNEATIRERLKVYFNQTTPVLEYYRKDGKLITIDGKLSIDEVAEKVVNALEG